MTLSALLTAFKTSGVKVALFTSDGESIITFYSEGYSGIESELLARTVKKFDFIVTRSASEAVTMNIYLLDEENNSQTTEPTTPTTGD